MVRNNREGVTLDNIILFFIYKRLNYCRWATNSLGLQQEAPRTTIYHQENLYLLLFIWRFAIRTCQNSFNVLTLLPAARLLSSVHAR